MKFSFPFRTGSGAEYKNVDDLFKLLLSESSGHYLLGKSNFWHGGIHLTDKTVPHCKAKDMIRCIGDGEVVAYRLHRDYLQSQWQGSALRYSTNFCLVRHRYVSPPAKGSAGAPGQTNQLTFFSLYMHLAPLSAYETDTAQGHRIKITASGLRVRDVASIGAASVGTIEQGAQLLVQELREIISDGKVYAFARATLQTQSIHYVDKVRKSKPGDAVWVVINCVSPVKKEIYAEFIATPSASVPKWWPGKPRMLIHSRVSARDGVGTHAKRLGLIAIGSELEYDPATVTELSLEGKKRKFAECTLLSGGYSGSDTKMPARFWVCIDGDFSVHQAGLPSQLDRVVTSSIPIKAGDPVGCLGLYESAVATGKTGQHQVHLEVFSADPGVRDFVQNKAGVLQEPLYLNLKQGARLFVSTGETPPNFTEEGAVLERDCRVPLADVNKVKDGAQVEWYEMDISDKTRDVHGAIRVASAERLCHHDWEKMGFHLVEAANASDGYLDKAASAPFFKTLYQKITDEAAPADREASRSALTGPDHQQSWSKIIARHPSEWKAKADDGLWAVLNTILRNVPDRHEHEKERINQTVWWDEVSGKVDGLPADGWVWHFHPFGFLEGVMGRCEEKCRSEVIELDVDSGKFLVSEKLVRFLMETESFQEYPYALADNSSGITIGYGYDLGQQTLASVERDLSGLYQKKEIDRLKACIGKRGKHARDYVEQVDDISITKERATLLAMRVKKRYAQQVVDIYPQVNSLHPDCQGALLSLVYNRGNSLEGPTRKEMKEIQEDFLSGNIESIPSRIRAMKRLWIGDRTKRGLLVRREKEAEFFEGGMKCKCW